MRIKFTSFIIVIVLFLSNSCQTYIYIPAITSPTLKVDEQAHRIGFINRYDYTVLPDQKLAKKAAHNLSLCLDAAGRINDAEYWRNKANE